MILPQLIKKVYLDFKERPIYRLQSEKILLAISCQTTAREAEGLCCFIPICFTIENFLCIHGHETSRDKTRLGLEMSRDPPAMVSRYLELLEIWSRDIPRLYSEGLEMS